MPLGTEVDLRPGDFVRWDPAPPTPEKGGKPPNIRPMYIVAKWLDESRRHMVER